MGYAEHGNDEQYYDWNINDSPRDRWYYKNFRCVDLCVRNEYPNWHSYEAWGWKGRSSDYSGSPRTPLPRSEVFGKYIMIQPRSVDASFRDSRMLYDPSARNKLITSVPITKKRKGNNRYGQSGSHRCARCQKGKRKV
jgi:hypothetical protein